MGPRGFTTHYVEGELRPGGAWRLCLRPDDGGKDLWQGGLVFKAWTESERKVFEAGRGSMQQAGPEPWTNSPLILQMCRRLQRRANQMTMIAATLDNAEKCLRGRVCGWFASRIPANPSVPLSLMRGLVQKFLQC
ncbi:MAG: hypothetical protein H0U72_11155 [Nitrosospira sp.]|nr:hypothetical protein [Nitrosospira sp.]